MGYFELAKLAGGYVEARAIQAALGLGIFEALRDSKNARRTAAATQCDPRATKLLLNAMVSIGLLTLEESVYSLNETSATFLLKDSPKYLGRMISFDSSLWKIWGELEKSVRSGKPARAPDMYQSDAKETEQFIGAMDSLVQARGDAEVLAEILDLGEVGKLLDVGSGPATYPIFLCRKHPALRVTIFDLAATLKITERFVNASGVGDRIRLVQGDYRRDPIPDKHQVAFLSNIIHSESVEENERLMAKIYGGLDRDGTIIIKDHILDDSLAHPSAGAVFSLLMLLTTDQGRCYTFNEVKSWLEKAGFQRVRELPLPPPLTSSLVIGMKP
jgi:SAM-dependent methyltransferase